MQSPEEIEKSRRLDEIATILATGIIRLIAKKLRKSANCRDISLDYSANQSVHGDKEN
jgi:hypothetical protein